MPKAIKGKKSFPPSQPFRFSLSNCPPRSSHHGNQEQNTTEPGVLVECDPSIKAIILKIDQDKHDYIVEDLDDQTLVIKESQLPRLKQRLEEVSLRFPSFFLDYVFNPARGVVRGNSAQGAGERMWMLISPSPFFCRSLPIRNKYRMRAVRTEVPGPLIKKEHLCRVADGLRTDGCLDGQGKGLKC